MQSAYFYVICCVQLLREGYDLAQLHTYVLLIYELIEEATTEGLQAQLIGAILMKILE